MTASKRSARDLTVVRHRFRNMEEARRAALFAPGEATLTLPLPAAVPVGDAVSVRFRVGSGQLHEAVGLARVRGRTLTVRFEGPEAEIVKDAIERHRYPIALRAQPRYPCCLPVTVETPRGTVQGIACDVGPGGTRLMALSAGLERGAAVQVRFGAQPTVIYARVVWAVAESPGGAAGLSFSDDPIGQMLVRKVVDEVAARDRQRKAS